MTDVILDASALLALLKNERGADQVASLIANSSMSAINYAEVISHFVHLGMPANEVVAMLSPLPITIVDADQSLAQTAGHLRAMTSKAGLSLGDRFCLALALRETAAAITADQSWKDVSKRLNVEIILIR
jgi:ribonuclease VapC